MSMMSRRGAICVASSLLAAAILVIRIHGAQATLPSGIFSSDELKVQKNSTTEIRQMFTGMTHSGYRIDLHETSLSAGQVPHAPHRHVHEELLLLREGTLEVTVAMKTSRLGPGSAVYIASNDEHGWKNIGTSPAKYFVMALGDDK